LGNPKTINANSIKDIISGILKMEEEKWLFGIKATTITIFLGVVASGVWGIFGEPLFHWFSNVVFDALNHFSDFYVNFLHLDIGKGLANDSIPFFIEFVLYILFVLALIITPLLGPLITWFKGEKKPNGIPKIKQRGKPRDPLSIYIVKLVLFFLLSFGGILFVTAHFIKNQYTQEAVVFTERAIEIVSPYLTQAEILDLRAKYRAVDNANKFIELEKSLRVISKNNGVDLPDFSSFAKATKKDN